jgi:PAS domain S-box-containing protein
VQKKNESPVQPGHIDSPHVLPGKKGIWFTPGVMVGIVILVLGGLLWTAYNITCKLYEEELDAHSREAAGMIAFHLENDCKYLLLLAEEKSRGKLDEKLFRERASLYVSDHPGLINITWADENFVIQWTAPYESNKQVVGLKLVLPEPALASRKAYETGKPFYTRPFEVIQGGAAFEVYVPVFQGDRFLGTFGGIYSIENVLLHHLPPYLRKQYRIDFLGNTGEAVCGLPPLAAIDRGLVRQVLLDPPGNGVSILLSRYEWHVWPTWVWLLIILSIGLAIGVGWGMIALRRDIDTRKRYELQLKEVNEQLRAGIDNMPNAYILVDTEYRVKEWNRKAEEIFGYTREEMMGKDPIDYIVPEEMRQCIRDPFKKHNPGNPVSYPGKNNNIRKDGTLITCLWSDTPMIDRSGSIYGILSMAQDITVQKESEEKIRRQHEFLHTTIDSLTHPFYVINADDFTVEMANLAAGSERIREAAGSGRIREKVTCYSLTHNRNTPCDLPQYICPVVEIKKTKKPYKTEHVHYDGNGNEFYSEIHGYPIFDKNGNVEKVIEYSLDITERKRMEEEKRRLADQLRHAQKMEAIGTLAGGVAHEFNNILGAIIGYTELSVDEAPENTTIRQNLEQVLIASDRAREMIRQILAFSRKDEIQRKPVLLGEIVSETLVLLKSTLPSFITIHSTIDENLKPIMANPTEIYQVLMNLCTNAAHAMKE